MIQHNITFSCGQQTTHRLTLLRDTEYELKFSILDHDGTPLDTVESWKGRIAEAYIGGFRVFYTGNPEHLSTRKSIQDSVWLEIRFGSDRWNLQLIASDSSLRMVPDDVQLPDQISCQGLSAGVARISEFQTPSTGSVRFNTGSSMVCVSEDGGVTRYSPTVQFLEPPAVQEAGHYLLFKRVYD